MLILLMLVMLLMLIMLMDVGFLGGGGDRNWWQANVAALTRTRWLSGFVIILLIMGVSSFIFFLGWLYQSEKLQIHSTKLIRENNVLRILPSNFLAGHGPPVQTWVGRMAQLELYTVYIEGDYCIWAFAEPL